MAQYPGMGAVYANMARQSFMNQQMQMSLMRSTMGYYGNLLHNNTYDFTITLKDSTKRSVRSKIYLDTALHQNYLVLENKSLAKKDSLRKQKIYAEQTVTITRSGVSTLNGPYTMVGLTTDSCWLFKVINGSEINVYSILSEPEFAQFDESTVAAIQKGDGPIIKVNEENLKEMIADDEDALKYFNKKKYFKAIKTYNKNITKLKRGKAPASFN